MTETGSQSPDRAALGGNGGRLSAVGRLGAASESRDVSQGVGRQLSGAWYGSVGASYRTTIRFDYLFLVTKQEVVALASLKAGSISRDI